MGSMPWDDAAVELALAPIYLAAGQLMPGLECPDVLLAVTGGLGVHRADDLCAVAPVAGPMRDPGFGTAETVGRSFRIVAFVPGIADQDELFADVQVGNSASPRQRS
jgi:hypothetical protein